MDDPDLPPPIETTPSTQEMERTESKDEQPQPMQSLRSKLAAHYKKGLRKPNTSVLTSKLTPEVINRTAVPLYLFTAFSTIKIGVIDVMPLIYDGNDKLVFLQQVLVVFIWMELMINWLGIRYVDSSYPRYLRIHGEVKLPGPSKKGNILTQETNVPAVIMPLMTEVNERNGNAKKCDAVTKKISESITSVGEIVRDATRDLRLEAERANEEMDRQIEQMNSKSIADLINTGEDKTSVSSHSLHSSTSSSNLSSQTAEHNLMNNNGKSDSVTSPTPVITTQGNTITKVYPYWSWVPCYDCGRTRPPRCHHCPLCQTCVLKRDHHCFFAGSCIGYRNHRFFVVFLIWAWIGCVYATLHGFPYIGFFLWDEMSYVDVLFPVAIIRFCLGYISFQAALSVTTLSFLLYFDMLTSTFIYVHSHLIVWGKTSFEKALLRSTLEIKDTRKVDQKIRAVFGKYWALNFLFPTIFFIEPEEDPIHWPHIEVYKN